MELEEYKKIINDIIKKYDGCFIGLHDCHNTSLSDKIEKNGLSVSPSAYGSRIKRKGIMDENGKIDLDRDFQATMYVISNQSSLESACTCVPVCPIIIVVPKEFIKMTEISPSSEDYIKILSGYGIEDKPKKVIGKFGEPEVVRGDIRPLTDANGANLRLMESCFVAGHIDIKTGKFVENPQFYGNLSESERQKLFLLLSERIKKYQELLQKQPQ